MLNDGVEGFLVEILTGQHPISRATRSYMGVSPAVDLVEEARAEVFLCLLELRPHVHLSITVAAFQLEALLDFV